MTGDRYRRWFGGLVLAAAVWRVLYVLMFKVDDDVVGDQIYYSGQAVTIANGNWFADPFIPGAYAADHAPLTALAVAPASWDDAVPFVAQRLLMAMYGTAVVAGIGLVTRWLTDRVTSLVAVAIAAVYANLWMNDALIMAETPSALAVVLVLFASYRFDLSRSTRDAVVMGLAVGLAGLARAELLLLGVVLVLPMVLFGQHASADRRRRVFHLAVAGLAAVALVSPWIIRNQVRFDETVTMSTQDGLTLVGTNCPAAFEGPGRGFWHLSCAFAVPVPDGADQSVRSAIYRDVAVDYLGDHLDQVPSVVVARLGRGPQCVAGRRHGNAEPGRGPGTIGELDWGRPVLDACSARCLRPRRLACGATPVADARTDPHVGADDRGAVRHSALPDCCRGRHRRLRRHRSRLVGAAPGHRASQTQLTRDWSALSCVSSQSHTSWVPNSVRCTPS